MREMIDANGNAITVVRDGRSCQGLPILICDLVGTDQGYLALEELDGAFGDESCPSSIGRPIMTWFGCGEAYTTAEYAIRAIEDGRR